MKLIFTFVCLLMILSIANINAQNVALSSSADGNPIMFSAIGDSCSGTGSEQHDNGSFENGYGWNTTVTDARFVIKFVPSTYPWKYNKFCMGLTRVAAGADSLKFDIVIYDTTGTGGGPGNLLGTLTNQVARPILVYPSYSWFSFDISTVAGNTVTAGGIFIGIKYDASLTNNQNKFIMVDENGILWPGFAYANTGWNTIPGWGGAFVNYKCLAMRTVGSLPVGIQNPNATNYQPFDYSLSQNDPNPFNPSTKISFSIQKTGLVTLKIFDILGKEVASLVNEVKNAGNYTVDFNASRLSSGVYFYRLSSGNFVDTKKMFLLK